LDLLKILIVTKRLSKFFHSATKEHSVILWKEAIIFVGSWFP